MLVQSASTEIVRIRTNVVEVRYPTATTKTTDRAAVERAPRTTARSRVSSVTGRAGVLPFVRPSATAAMSRAARLAPD